VSALYNVVAPMSNTSDISMHLNYFVDRGTKDIYKGIKVNNLITGYVKYKSVEYKTERRNKDGYYYAYAYPFESYAKSRVGEREFFRPFNLFLPKIKARDVDEISQTEVLRQRLEDDCSQMALVRKMFGIFEKRVKGFDSSVMGLDASLQCRLEAESSDIDLVVRDAELYRKLFSFITSDRNFTMFSANVVDRRGAYSSFMTTKELDYFESRKLSFLFKGVKVSIIFSEIVNLPEPLISTNSLIFVRSRPGVGKSVGEPSLVDLGSVEVIYGPRLNCTKIYYLSVLPVRTGFILRKDDTLYVMGIIYVGEKTHNVYISQFTWDYCQLFSEHNIALNTYLRISDDDKKIVGHFFDNLKL
jgi:predicted nucleotidyltransferase